MATGTVDITIAMKDKVPQYVLINGKKCMFEQTDLEIEYYAEDGKWGVFYNFDDEPEEICVQRLNTRAMRSYKPRKSCKFIEL